MNVTNEMETVIVFSQQAAAHGITIVSAGAEFPDAVIELDYTKYRVEFEYRARNFVTHGHDPRLCDAIVCWINDYEDSALPIIELSTDTWPNIALLLPDETEKEIAYWKQRALNAEARMRKPGDSLDYPVYKQGVAEYLLAVMDGSAAFSHEGNSNMAGAQQYGLSRRQFREIRARATREGIGVWRNGGRRNAHVEIVDINKLMVLAESASAEQ